MLRVTPIYGSRWDPNGGSNMGSCTLVEYGNVKVLVDVGLNDNNNNYKDDGLNNVNNNNNNYNIMSTIPEHDCVVITNSTLQAMGNLPVYYNNYSNNNNNNNAVPIYATFPTVKMGQMTLYDYHANVSLDGGRPPFTLEEMDAAFGQLQTIKYSQTLYFTPKGASKPSLSITAHRAGHAVGGAFFILQKLQDETFVVITSTYHIAKELHLDSSTLLQNASGPDVLITRPGGSNMVALNTLYNTKKLSILPLVSQAQRNLMDTILSVLRRAGNVLLPADASGRVLELILLLSQQWDKQRLSGTYNLCWVGPMVPNTLEFCRSQLEWMSNKLGNQFDSFRHPYQLKNVTCCSSMTEYMALINSNPKYKNNPTCVVASGLDLDHGPARDFLLKWADNDLHAIIFTDSSGACKRRVYNTNSNNNAATSETTTTTITAMEVDDKQESQATTKMESAQDSASDKNPVTATNVTASVPATNQSAPTTTNTGPSQQQQQQQPDVADAQDGTAEGDGAMVGDAIEDVTSISKMSTTFQLLKSWCDAKYQEKEMDDSVNVDVLVPYKAPLGGVELSQFLKQEEAARLSKLKKEEEQAMLREVELAKGRLRLGEEDGTTTTTTKPSESSSSSKMSNTTTTTVTYKYARPKKKSRFDSSLFLKFSKPLHLMFEVREEAVGIGQADSIAKFGIGESVGRSDILEDDYGIAVNPDHFVDIVTGVDPSKFSGGSGRIGEEVLRRGFGFGVVDGAGGGGGAGAASGAKGRGAGTGGSGAANDDDGSNELNEHDLEAADLSEGRGIIRGRKGRPPTKVTTLIRRLEVLAEIDYIPLEGRVDARSARQSVRALQPRQVIVLGGPKATTTSDKMEVDDNTTTTTTTSPNNNNNNNVNSVSFDLVDEVTLLAQAAQSFTTANNDMAVPTPTDMTSIILNVGHAAYSVRLLDTPYRTAQEKEQEEEPPEPIEPYEAKLGACTVSYVDYVATGKKVALDGSIVLAPVASKNKRDSSYLYLSDGEVLLTNLRSELIAQGMKAEYSAHAGYSQLIVNGKIVVKKQQDSGKVDVEGPLCQDFFAVRSVVCGQYVTL